jgi:hypothetical protein
MRDISLAQLGELSFLASQLKTPAMYCLKHFKNSNPPPVVVIGDLGGG